MNKIRHGLLTNTNIFMNSLSVCLSVCLSVSKSKFANVYSVDVVDSSHLPI